MPRRGERQMEKKSFSIVIKMWHLVKKYRLQFYVGFLVGSTSRFYYRFLESFLVEKFTSICVSGNQGELLSGLIIVLALIIVGMIVYPISFGLVYTTYALMSGEIKRDIFAKAMKVKPTYIEKQYSGELVTKITADYNDAIQLIAYPVVGQGNPFSLLFTVVMIAVVILYRSPLLGSISLALTLVNLGIMKFMIEPMRAREKKTKSITQDFSQNIIDALSGMMVSRMFGLNSMLVKKYETSTEDIYQNNLSLVKSKSILALVIDTQSFLSFTVVCAIGLFLCTKEMISIPTVLFISLLQMSLGTYIRELSNKMSGIQKYIVGAKRMFEFLDAPEEDIRPVLAEPHYEAAQAIELVDITFQYPETNEKLFEKFSLSIGMGEKIGIAGGSGGGKSSLMKLFLEFVEPDAGKIRLFGNDAQKYSQEQVRGFFSYVPQDCYLFDGTIRENIMFGNLKATDAEVQQAVQSAYLTEFIDSIPEGLDKRVGERGNMLSGGQRQRVAIARAFLKNAPILLLDEATSALDSQSEEIVQKAITRLMENRTSIVIAHRLSTIQDMDRILVMEQGGIQEEGTHEELLKKKGRYYQLSMQSKD